MAAAPGVIVWAWTRDVQRPLSLPAQEKRLTEPVSRYGATGRGAALLLVGIYLIVAAIDADSAKVHSPGGVLQQLRHNAYGWVLLFAPAFGAPGSSKRILLRDRHPDREDVGG